MSGYTTPQAGSVRPCPRCDQDQVLVDDEYAWVWECPTCQHGEIEFLTHRPPEQGAPREGEEGAWPGAAPRPRGIDRPGDDVRARAMGRFLSIVEDEVKGMHESPPARRGIDQATAACTAPRPALREPPGSQPGRSA